jgi:hypothetical protein
LKITLVGLIYSYIDNTICLIDDDSIDTYFDCVEQIDDDCDLVELQEFRTCVCSKLLTLLHLVSVQQLTTNTQDQLSDDNLIQLSTVSQPWVSEIWLSMHRKYESCCYKYILPPKSLEQVWYVVHSTISNDREKDRYKI